MTRHAALSIVASALALCSACAPSSSSSSVPPAPGADPPNMTTLFGGLAGERVQGVHVLANGNILVAGETVSDFLALPQFHATLAPPFDATLNAGSSSDAYVAVLDSTFSHVLYWTYLGGSGQDRAYFAGEDEQGNIWICGFTGSHDGAAEPFPAGLDAHCYKAGGCAGASPDDWDVFVVKLRFDLSAPLLATTILGGSAMDSPRGTLDVGAGFVHVSGATQSVDFPVTIGLPAHSASGGSFGDCGAQVPLHDGFVARLSAVDGALEWARVLGGEGDDTAWAGVRADPSSGELFVAGSTSTLTLALDLAGIDAGAQLHRYDSFTPGIIAGAYDGFVARLSSAGGVLAVGYLGGTGHEWLAVNDGLELDPQGRPVVVGLTRSGDLATTPNALSARHSNLPAPGSGCATPPIALDDCDEDGADLFVARLSHDLATADYVSYVNAPANGCASAYFREEPSGLALFGDAILIAGETDSPALPVTATAFDALISAGVTPPGSAAHDAFLIQLRPSASATLLQYGTFFGGDALSLNAAEPGNRARCLAVFASGPRAGQAVFSGQTTALDFGSVTTRGVVFADWLAGDEREGFVAVHDTTP